jgi:hypothetical protein
MNTITVSNGITKKTLTENDILNFFADKSVLESILFMLIEGSDTFENGNEVEFPRSEAKNFLEIYFKDSDYSKEYINKILNLI